jgi:polyisoprenoid-binding protein YceI
MSSTTTTSSSASVDLPAGTWSLDPTHTHIGFTVRHMMVAKVRGSFSEYSAEITVGENPLDSTLSAVVQMASIDTGNGDRDGHLRTNDFFAIDEYPTMTLQSTGIEAKGGDYVLHADLTIKGVTKSVAFDLEFAGTGQDPWGNTKAGFTASATINRKDFGIEWNAPLETGGVLVGEQVKIEIDAELLKA